MTGTCEPRTLEEIKQGLDYSFNSFDQAGFGLEFREVRDRFLASLPEASSAPPGLPVDQVPATAQAILHYCDSLPRETAEVSAGFGTLAFLSGVLRCIAAGSELDVERMTVLQTLQKRFEVHRRIFDRYAPTLNRTGDSFQDLSLYAVFSLALALLFLLTKRFTYLNTALKVNDLIAGSGWPRSDDRQVRLALALEREILGGFDVT